VVWSGGLVWRAYVFWVVYPLCDGCDEDGGVCSHGGWSCELKSSTPCEVVVLVDLVGEQGTFFGQRDELFVEHEQVRAYGVEGLRDGICGPVEPDLEDLGFFFPDAFDPLGFHFEGFEGFDAFESLFGVLFGGEQERSEYDPDGLFLLRRLSPQTEQDGVSVGGSDFPEEALVRESEGQVELVRGCLCPGPVGVVVAHGCCGPRWGRWAGHFFVHRNELCIGRLPCGLYLDEVCSQGFGYEVEDASWVGLGLVDDLGVHDAVVWS